MPACQPNDDSPALRNSAVMCICDASFPTCTCQVVPCDSDTRAFHAEFDAVVFRVLPWAFPGLVEAE